MSFLNPTKQELEVEDLSEELEAQEEEVDNELGEMEDAEVSRILSIHEFDSPTDDEYTTEDPYYGGRELDFND